MHHFCVKITQAARRARASALLLGLVLLSSCSTQSPLASWQRFSDADAADFITRYFIDQTSFMVKPVTKDGAYQSICDRARLLQIARQTAGRDLAVIVVIRHQTIEAEEPVELDWVNDLTGLSYRRVVFVRGNGDMQVNGLPVLETPRVPAAFAGK